MKSEKLFFCGRVSVLMVCGVGVACCLLGRCREVQRGGISSDSGGGCVRSEDVGRCAGRRDQLGQCAAGVGCRVLRWGAGAAGVGCLPP